MCLIRFILLGWLLFVTSSAFSWNSVGHRMVALIAYQHLTPEAKYKVDALTRTLFHSHYGNSRFMKAAAWPDTLRYDDISAFDNWHFIDVPYVVGHVIALPTNKENVTWAVLQSEKVVGSSRSNPYEKMVFLNFLTHFVGDAHQPLHCISRYSKALPLGDQGGNLYPIKSNIANNLHGLWDRGLGLFYDPVQKVNWNYKVMRKIAKQITTQYPPSYFKKQLADLNPYNWTQQGYRIAKDFVYTVSQNTFPTPQYIQRGRNIVKQRVALAGYRLAAILNQLL